MYFLIAYTLYVFRTMFTIENSMHFTSITTVFVFQIVINASLQRLAEHGQNVGNGCKSVLNLKLMIAKKQILW